jgi:DNA-binding NtrC family response regulator
LIVSDSTTDSDSSHKPQNGILSPLENTKVLHFLRRIDNPPDLHFELIYNKPDLILTGRTMDDFSALDVLNLTKARAADLPVIVLAPDYDEDTNFELIDNGAYDILFHQEIKRLPNEVAFISEAYRMRRTA